MSLDLTDHNTNASTTDDNTITQQNIKDSLLKLETNAERRFYHHYLNYEHEQFYSAITIQRYKKSFLLKYGINIHTPKF